MPTKWGKLKRNGEEIDLDGETLARALFVHEGHISGEALNQLGNTLWIAQNARNDGKTEARTQAARAFMAHAQTLFVGELPTPPDPAQTALPTPTPPELKQPALPTPPEVEDPTDKDILLICQDDPDLKDDDVSLELATRYGIRNPETREPLSRQAINTRRKRLELMGYKVR